MFYQEHPQLFLSVYLKGRVTERGRSKDRERQRDVFQPMFHSPVSKRAGLDQNKPESQQRHPGLSCGGQTWAVCYCLPEAVTGPARGDVAVRSFIHFFYFFFLI